MSNNTETHTKLLHDANSRLAIIWGYIQLIEKQLGNDPTLKHRLSKISTECAELSEMLTKLRTAQ